MDQVVLPPPSVGDGEGEAGDEEEEEDDGHDDDEERVEVELWRVVCVVGTFQLAVVVVLYTGAALRAEDLAVMAGVGVPADALALLVVPGVGGAVETGELVPGEVRETVTGAGVR